MLQQAVHLLKTQICQVGQLVIVVFQKVGQYKTLVNNTNFNITKPYEAGFQYKGSPFFLFSYVIKVFFIKH